MKLRERYRRLSFWHKLGTWGSIASIFGVPVGIFFLVVWFLPPQDSSPERKGSTSFNAEPNEIKISREAALKKSDAALVIAGMYLGQAGLRLGDTSEKTRSAIRQQLRNGRVGECTTERVSRLLDDAAQAVEQDNSVRIIDKLFGELGKAADKASPAYGQDAFEFGFFLGIVVTGINPAVDMPTVSPEQSATILKHLQKLCRSPAFVTIKIKGSRLPFPPRMRKALDQMLAQEPSTLDGCQQMAQEAALFSFLLWLIAEEGSRALDVVRHLPDNECVSRMSVRLELEGFAVSFPGVPSKLALPPGGDLQ